MEYPPIFAVSQPARELTRERNQNESAPGILTLGCHQAKPSRIRGFQMSMGHLMTQVPLHGRVNCCPWPAGVGGHFSGPITAMHAFSVHPGQCMPRKPIGMFDTPSGGLMLPSCHAMATFQVNPPTAMPVQGTAWGGALKRGHSMALGQHEPTRRSIKHMGGFAGHTLAWVD